MKIIVIMLIPIIILAFLYNKGFIPQVVYFCLLILIVVIGFYYIFITYNSMMRRDNMNYQQYDWSFNPSKAPTSTTNPNENNTPWSTGSTKLCIGPQCCNQFEMFDASLNKCMLLPTATSQSSNSTSGTNLNAGVNSSLSNLGQDIKNEYSGLTSSAAKYIENI
jgi:hypothetical protein